jgi:predicted nucleotidyltransferase
MIQIEPRHYEIVKDVLSKYPYTFYAYGSRAKKTAHQFSDLDICSLEPIPRNIISSIEEDFYLSNLPYTVDIVDWTKCSPEFQASIKNDLIKLSYAPSTDTN